jgi:hypothetical protein
VKNLKKLIFLLAELVEVVELVEDVVVVSDVVVVELVPELKRQNGFLFHVYHKSLKKSFYITCRGCRTCRTCF